MPLTVYMLVCRADGDMQSDVWAIDSRVCCFWMQLHGGRRVHQQSTHPYHCVPRRVGGTQHGKKACKRSTETCDGPFCRVGHNAEVSAPRKAACARVSSHPQPGVSGISLTYEGLRGTLCLLPFCSYPVSCCIILVYAALDAAWRLILRPPPSLLCHSA